jgi:hypothetical protein
MLGRIRARARKRAVQQGELQACQWCGKEKHIAKKSGQLEFCNLRDLNFELA